MTQTIKTYTQQFEGQQVQTVGMYGGKFCPFHKGHLYSILRASAMVDKLYVVVSYIEERDRELCKQAHLPYITHQQRALWIRQATKDAPNIVVLYVEDVSMELGAEHAWDEGARRIINAIPEKITHVFSSESSYDYWFKRNYGADINHVIIDEARDLFPISATKIRNEGVYVNWDMIPDVCRPFYVKKIAIVGVESTGKSTIVRNLAKLFDTTYADEYGLVLCEYLGNGSDLLTDDHYKEIVYGHKHLEYQELRKANKVFFLDSEAIVSQYYAKMYQGHELPFIESVIDTQDYDLYIFLEPDVKWVADGYRTFNDAEKRNHTNNILKDMFIQRGIDFVSISGTYEQRLQKCLTLVADLLKAPVA